MSIQQPNIRVLIPDLLERDGPLTRAELAARLDLPPRSSTLDDALKRLRTAGCIAHDPTTRRWSYRAPYVGAATITQPGSVTTPRIMERVYRACHGLTIRETVQKTGLSKITTKRCLERLAAHGRIHYRDGAWRHLDAAPVAEPAITSADLDWQRYWHPDNRSQRRAEALRA